MSDYFTFPKRENGSTSKQPGTPGSTRNSSKNLELPRNYRTTGGSSDELSSMYSGDSQYLMDMIPDSLTLKNEPISGNLSNLTQTNGPDDKKNKEVKLDEYILPKTDSRSPYYVNVPIPKKLPKSEGKTKAKQKVKDKADPSDLDVENIYEASPEFVREYPTDILIDRFHKWKKILKSLIAYFREAAYSQEQIARINYQLKNAVKFAFLTDLEDETNKLVDPSVPKFPSKKPQPVPLVAQKSDSKYEAEVEQSQSTQAVPAEEVPSASSGFMTFGSGSIQDIQVILKKYHLSLGSQQYKISKEIVAYIIPKLTDLRKDLTAKMKEIKELHGDFKTNIGEHVKITSRLLNKYIASVKFLDEASASGNKQGEKLRPKHDPYLLKLQLDLQLKRQLLEENYLREAFLNLQSAALQLEKIVYSKIQSTLQRYSALIDSEARLMIKNLCHELQQGILSRPPAVEWDNFVSHHPTCLMNLKSTDPPPQPRTLSDIVYPNMKSPLAKCIRVGYLLKKTESSKNFTKGYFVLTTNYLHEFKSSDFFLENKSPRAKNKSPIEQSDAIHINKDGANAGSHPSSNGTQDLKVTKRRKGLSSSNLYPVTSLSLNGCSLKDSTDTSFVLQGYASYHLSEDASTTESSVTSNLTCTPKLLTSNKSKHQRTPSALSMVSVPKFLKGSSGPKEQKRARENSNTNKNSICEKYVEWTFKISSASLEPTSEDSKIFKKWVQDVKALTSFNSTQERSNFIEEKVLRSRNHNNGKSSQSSKKSTFITPVDSFVNLSEKATPSSSVTTLNTRKRANRPRYIDIPKGANTNAGAMNSVYRSKVNTPAIDENGNLAIVGESRNSGSQNAVSYTSRTPCISPYSLYSGGSVPYYRSTDDLTTSPSQKASAPGEVPQIAVSNHGDEAIIPASAYSDSGHKSSRGSSVPSIHNRRDNSSSSPLMNLPGVSPSCLALDGNANGYFGIPLNCNSEARGRSELSAFEMESPLFEEDRTQNYGRSCKCSACYMPQQCGPMMEINHAGLSHDNEKGTSQSSLMLKKPLTSKGELPYGNSKKASSAENVPLISTVSNDKSLYSRQNRSTNNVPTTSASSSEATETYPIRQHRKNMSFGSLNSVIDNKNVSNNFPDKSRKPSATRIGESDEDKKEKAY